MYNLLNRTLPGVALVFALICMLAALFCLTDPAFAGDGATAGAGSFVDTAFSALGVVLSGVAIWGTRALTVWLGIRNDSEIRAYLEQATQMGIQLALAKLREQISFATDAGSIPVANNISTLAPDLRDAVVDDVAAYLDARVPDALARFRLDAAGVRDFVTARIPTMTGVPVSGTAD